MTRMFKGIIGLLLVSAFFWMPVSAASKYKVVTVSNGGSVSGKVTLQGAQPAPEKILITKNKEVCGTGNREVQWVPLGKNQGLLETVVYLKKIKKGKGWKGALPASKGTMDQKKCLFSPWLQIVKIGAGMTIRNSDPVLHNIHIRELIGIKVGKARGVKRTMLNEAQPGAPGDPAQDLETKIKPRRSNFVAINCEAHNFMFAWMFAANHPYVAKTGADGSYKIDGIPPGKYTLSVWHPTLGLQEKKIKVKGGDSLSQSFSYKVK